MNSFEIIKSVRLTEKATLLSSKPKRRPGQKLDKGAQAETEPLNRYSLVVDRRANKVSIRQAVEELFKVKVLRVNTLNCRGKERRKRTMHAGKTPDWKKAIVTLKQGDRINLT